MAIRVSVTGYYKIYQNSLIYSNTRIFKMKTDKHFNDESYNIRIILHYDYMA